MNAPPSSLPVPRGPADLTASWLNQVLAGRLPEVSDVEVVDDLFQGMMAEVFRLRLDYSDSLPDSPSDSVADSSRGADAAEDAPATLIAKVASRNEAMRLRPQTISNTSKEVGFYRELVGFLGERGVASQAAAGVPPVPWCYYGAVEAETGHQILLLEDLAPALPRPEGCTLTEARLAVRALAAFHGRWWGQDLSRFDWLPPPVVPEAERIAALFSSAWPTFQAAAGPRLPKDMTAYGERLGRQFAELMERLLIEAPVTLRHGDYSLSNLLFPTPAGGRFAIIDWAGIGQGKGAWDLAWLLGQSFPVESRRAWEAELLTCYREGLIAAGVQDYSAESLLSDYRLAIAQRFGTIISSVVALPFTAAQKEKILDEQLPRNLAAIADHGGLRLLD
ncbi:MAG: aminoglycoside phosphotransferase family protein [Pseudomonadota bacterium]